MYAVCSFAASASVYQVGRQPVDEALTIAWPHQVVVVCKPQHLPIWAYSDEEGAPDGVQEACH